MIQSLAILAAALSLASCHQPQPAEPAPPAIASPVPKPPAPAFKPGMVAVDRTGARLGEIKSVAETPGGLNVVIEIDGKLVGVLPTTLEMRGETAVSSQTKEEILATAGAPR